MVHLPPRLREKLEALDAQHEDLAQRLMDPEVLASHEAVREISIHKARLEPLVEDFRRIRSLDEQIREMQGLTGDGDAELAELARQELPELQRQADELVQAVQRRLVQADDEAVGSVILEIRPGVGGDEAAIWAGDLLSMYQRYASGKRWKVEPLQITGAEQGGCKLAIIAIAGDGVWSHLGYEGGTHQVKRVPVTETQGRVHTSTATVAVLPEPEEVEVEIDAGDVREMITTAQGPGGQNVNKVATAVHLIHEPTGIEVRMQDTKSQAQNREKAWKVLRRALYERQTAEAQESRAEARNAMIGSGSRAEKIRTYRYKENLTVDHRLGQSFNLTDILAGNLDPLIEALIEQDTAQRLAAL